MFKFFKKEEVIESGKKIKAITTVDRPKQKVIKLSSFELEKIKSFKKSNNKVDPYFLQDVVDRICGPESEEYKKAIIEVNKKFKSRPGRTGKEIFNEKYD